NKKKSRLPEAEHRRRKRELFIIGAIAVLIPSLAFIGSRIIQVGASLPISNTVLLFILININLLLLILMIFLIFRNIVKLLYDRKAKVMGAKLRTKLVLSFITLTFLPTIILFLFSLHFIATSIEFWFNVPIEQSLDNSLKVGRSMYKYIEDNNIFFLKKISSQIKTRKLLAQDRLKDLLRYIQIVQKDFNNHAIEVYDNNLNRAAFTISQDVQNLELNLIQKDYIKKEIDTKGSLTISENIDNGELLRSISYIPFGVPKNESEGFLVITFWISQKFSEDIESISKGVEGYQQIKLLKKPIQRTYYITLSIVALLVLFCAIWFGFYISKLITIPIIELSNGIKRVAEGDLGVNINVVTDDEIGTLVSSFNKMTKDLRYGREQLELSAKMLKEQNIELEHKQQYMEIVLKNVSAGVISIDSNGFVSTINKAAEKMLNIKAEVVLNKIYKNILAAQHLDLAKEIYDKVSSDYKETLELPLKLTINGRSRSFMVHINALQNESCVYMGMVMVFDDLTELEKAQRMAAWREVARRVAHEVKNPLTPIKLSAQRLQRKYSEQIQDPIFDECTNTIVDHVDLIKNLVNEFSTFARFPAVTLSPSAIMPVIFETVALYKEGYENIKFEVNATSDIPILNIDKLQIKRAMINIVDNAVAAIKDQGSIIITLTHEIDLKQVKIEVADNGISISDEDKAKLFEPYFSTKKSGMGLGLSIVSTIIAEHNGSIKVMDNIPQGAKFIIELPV
ncbi:MAG: HAMP domain-containing protein, partial [Desulfobacterales bacterium]|nr:HAMP domain-containing protein [Desulfobacterales bacterium]